MTIVSHIRVVISFFLKIKCLVTDKRIAQTNGFCCKSLIPFSDVTPTIIPIIV